ncbi:MAG: hypothetical protein R3266_01875 [Gemmatimonadota bacterium]|nr:hypothetical protein [Gemmatimonadota bacterium]
MRANEAVTSCLCLLACLGCGLGSETASRSAGTARDSAGIRLVRHGAGAQGTVSIPGALEPDLRIDPDPLRPETQFGHLADLAVDSDGRIYALDQQARHVVVFGPEGATRRIIGGPGEGPGELGRFAWSLALTADTLAVVDWGRGVLHRFTVEGTYVDAPRLGLAGGTRSWWRPAAEGGFLARTLTRFADDEGRWRGDDRLLRIAADGTIHDTAVRFHYAESDLGGPGDPRVPLIVNAPIWAELPDGRIAWTTLASEETIYGVSRDALDREVILRIRRRTGRPALPGRSRAP